MEIRESIKLALEGLRVNKMRSFLTMLGIIIGIGSVIAIMTIGRATSNSVGKSFDAFGTKLVSIYIEPKDQDNWDRIGDKDLITDNMIEELKNRFSSEIESIAINAATGSGKIEDGKKYANITLNSVNDGIVYTDNIKMLLGRFVTEQDMLSSRNIAIISDKSAKKIFGNVQDALGQEIDVNINNKIATFSVVGIYKYENKNIGMFQGKQTSEEDLNTNLYVPVNTGKMILNDNASNYSGITIKLKSDVDVKQFSDKLQKYMNNAFYKNNEYAAPTVTSLESVIEKVNKSLGMVKIAISAIAGISLLVGGIGVMNILLVSVTERTREIGIRKALGATNGDIKAQFIIESIIICIIGGIFGVALGTGIGILGSSLMKEPTLPSLSSIIIAVGFSMAIGIFFGYYPSNKAAKLDPIDALRYE